jgi:transposase-like protein
MNQSRVDSSGARSGRAAHYAKLLSEQESSGQSVRSFATDRGLSPLTLYMWRRKLGRTRRRAATGNGGLVAVDLLGHSAVPAESSAGFEVLLASGDRVRVPRDISTSHLVELVRALRSC